MINIQGHDVSIKPIEFKNPSVDRMLQRKRNLSAKYQRLLDRQKNGEDVEKYIAETAAAIDGYQKQINEMIRG